MPANDGNDALTRVLHWRSTLTPGDAAELRRCRTVDQVCMQPSFVRLVWNVRSTGAYQRDEDLAIAAVLAASFPGKTRAKEQASDQDVATAAPIGRRAALRVLGQVMAVDKLVSEPRFRRLMRLRSNEYAETLLPQDHDERLSALRRLRHLVGEAAGRRAVAEALLHLALKWSDRTKRELATSYFQPLESTPGSSPASEA